MSSFLELCYLARRSELGEDTLLEIEQAIERFHETRKIFQESGVRPDGFSLPRQHSIVHYPRSIREFGAPNGLCSSITESRHITAVKKPWRRSNRYEALGQMLLTNQRLDKLAAARSDFVSRGMLPPTHVAPTLRQSRALAGANGANEEEVIGPVDSKTDPDGEVILARRRRKLCNIYT